MTSFTNRIKSDSTELERYFLSIYTGNLWDALEKIKDWHSPEHIEKEVQMKLLKIQKQALPVVPECVAEYIERCKRSDCGLIWAIRPDRDANDNSEKVYDWLFPNGVKLPNGMYPNPYEPDNLVRPDKENQIKFVRAWLDGYTVEKPQLFKLIFPNSTAVLQKDGELNSFADTAYKRYLIKNAMTEQEIKSIDERYWQFAVPVEDGE